MATGVKTRSQSIKDALQARNYYTPTNTYDINNNSVTQALNAVNQYSNFDLRNSFITNYVEGSLIQDSPIVQNAQIQQLKFLTLNTAQKVVQNQMPVFNMNQGGNLLSKAKDFFTGKAYRFRSLAITSKDAQNKEIISINNLTSLVVGGIDHGYSKSMFEKIYGGNMIGSYTDTFNVKNIMDFNYNILGDFTKDHIVNLSNQNFYGPRKTSDTIKYGYTLNELVNGDYFKYGSSTPTDTQRTYLQADGVNPRDVGNEFKGGTFDNPIDEFLSYNNNDKVWYDKRIEKDFGFGTTERYDADTKRMVPIEGIFNSGNDISDSQGANAKRGILYFTKQILESQHGKELAGDNISYKQGPITPNGEDVVTYRGRGKCRSWTNTIGRAEGNNQYGSELKKQLLTINQYNGGNGVQNSVMYNNVRPNIHPKLKDAKNEVSKTTYMFSLENLAFDTASYADLPKSEQGYFGGRLMWFAPYGIEFSEQTAANWESHKFVGRPEPVYSYNGAERSGTLSFMLIMDYPLSDYKLDQMDYSNPNFLNKIYKSCEDEVKSKDNTNKQVTKLQSIKRLDVEGNSDLVGPMFGLKFYFDNDGDVIDINYNPKNVNDEYKGKIDTVKKIINSNKGSGHNITIEGYCSAKYNINYNAKLGFRRAYALMKACYQGNLKNPDNFVDETFTYKKDSKGNRIEITSGDTASTVFKFVTSDNSDITFNLISFGEDFSSATDTVSDDAIKSRYSYVKNIVPTKQAQSSTLNNQVLVIDQTTIISQPTQTTDVLENNIYQDWESQSTIGKSGNDLLDIDFARPNKLGSGYMDTFIPTYHSQTPYDFHNRLTFLNQCMRPGRTLSSNDKQYVPNNSVFGKQPVITLRLGDFLHTKLIITNLDIKYEQLWDLNPNGHGVQPMVAKVNLAVKIIGGQSLATPIAQLQNAISTMFYANSTFRPKGQTFDPFDPKVNKQMDNASTTESNQVKRYDEERKDRDKAIKDLPKT
jgi:hypothetical protein